MTALLSLAFTRLTLLRFWDPAEWLPTILLVAMGLGIALFSDEGSLDDHGPGPLLWVAWWMLISSRDPVLGLLGAGLAPLVFVWGQASKTGGSGQAGSPYLNWLLPLLLGLFLPRPWWDWGLQAPSALPLAAFGLGGAVASLAFILDRARQVPAWIFTWALAATGLLYAPAWGLAWGAAMGILSACAWDRMRKPAGIGAVAGFWILGMLLSFTLQANAWLPGLRHFIWLGN
jgi:hypothetical protein